MPTETFESRAEPGPEQPNSSPTVDQTFPVGEQCRLVVENPRGQIRVTGWDRPEVHLRATKLSDGSSLARFNATSVDVRHDGSSVFARTVLDGSAPLRDRSIWDDFASDVFRAFADLLRNTAMPAEVDYEIQVPRHADLELRGVTSRIAVEGVRGEIRLNNVSGPERLDHVQGDLVLSTVSGSIDGRDVDGYLDAKTVSGSIHANGRLDVVKANTVSGSMEIATSLSASGSYDLHSVSGSVTLRLPPDASASIGAHGVSMAVTSDLPCRVLRDTRRPGSRQWQGELNGGAATVHFHTVSGHLYLTYAADARDAATSDEPSVESKADGGPRATENPQAAPVGEGESTGEASAAEASPAAGASSAGQPVSEESAQLRILRALERGELAVDEALKQLEGLRQQDHE